MVTADGAKVLSAALPREIADIENSLANKLQIAKYVGILVVCLASASGGFNPWPCT